MSRERNLKRLRKSLHETQDTLDSLIAETSSELEKQWDGTRSDVSKRLQTTGKQLEKSYGKARTRLDSTLGDSKKEAGKLVASSRKDAEKLYTSSRKEAEKNYEQNREELMKRYNEVLKNAEKAYEGGRKEFNNRYAEARTEASKKLGELKMMASERGEMARSTSANWLQGLAAGVLAVRNRLEPKKRLAIRDEKEKYHLGKGGYFKRFVAMALIIVAKKDLILSLGQQLYSKLQDAEARQSVKNDALEQYDTMRRLMKAYAGGHYREFPYASIVKIVAAVVYFVSVVDLVPDFIPILGLTDDLAILAWVYSSVKDDLQKFVDWEAANERRREKMEGQRSDTRAVADRGAASPAPEERAATSSPGKSATTTGGTGSEKAGMSGTAASSGNTSTTNSNRVPPTGGSINPSPATGSTGGAGAETGKTESGSSTGKKETNK